MYRRALLSTVPLLAILAGCGTSAATIDAQVLADAQGLVAQGKTIFAAIEQIDPSAIAANVATDITNLAASASAALTSLTGNTLAVPGATSLQTVETYLNTLLSALQSALPAASVAFPVLSPYIPYFDAMVALLPGIEQWVNQVLAPASVRRRLTLHPISSHLTPAQARKWLGIAPV